MTWNGKAANPFTRTAVPQGVVAGTVQASADAKLVLGAAIGPGGPGLQVWPLSDITKMETMRTPLPVSAPFWRPGPTAPYEVIWTVGGVPTRSVELVRYGTDSKTTLYTDTPGAEPRAVAAAVRPDGSAVLVAVADPPTRLIVVDLATRQATEISTTLDGSLTESRGVLLR